MLFKNLSESHVSPEIIEPSFDIYKDAGGILKQESYEAIIAAQKQSSLEEHSDPTLMQARSFGNKMDIPVDEAIYTVYALLRAKVNDIPGINETDASVIRRFCDQKIFAEALLIHNCLDDHTSFVSNYPNIFDNHIE